MPGKKKYKKPTSKAQARFYGAVAGGAIKSKGLSKSEAKGKLRGVKYKELPARKK